MLGTVYYIATPDLLHPPVHTEAEGILALHAEASDALGLMNCYHKAYMLHPSCRFCLSVNITGEITSDIEETIISFFFFPNYFKEKGAPVIIVPYSTVKEAKKVTDSLSHQAKLQGYEQVNVQRIPSATGVIAYDSNQPEKIKQVYKEVVNHPSITERRLYVKISQLSDLLVVNQLLKEEEQLFKQQYGHLYFLEEQNKMLIQRLQQLEVNYKAAQQEISDQRSHMHVLRSGAQAAHLQNYYNNEYEVLPLWYKRFGHILKFLTGKRPFRSLFNDHIKKYKD